MAASGLADAIAPVDDATTHDSCVQAAHAMGPPSRRIDPAQGIAPEPGAELCATVVRRLADLDDRRADDESTLGGQVRLAQVEVDVELVPGERPALLVGLDDRQDAGADEGQLGRQVRRRPGDIAGPERPASAGGSTAVEFQEILYDVEERRLWEKFLEVYEDTIRNTSTKHAPWYVIPADRKWFARLVVSAVLVERMKALDLQYPKFDEASAAELEKAQAALREEAKKLKA